VGIPSDKLRWRQHRKDEMAHYAKDCWDGEILITNPVTGKEKWLEIVGIANRSDHDMRKHGEYTKNKVGFSVNLNLHPNERKMKISMRSFDKLKEEYGREIAQALKRKESVCVPGDDIEVDKKKYSGDDIWREVRDIESERKYPHVIEPSFGLDRLFYCILETAWKDDERGEWLSLAECVSPYDVVVAAVVKKDGLAEKAKEVCKMLLESGIDAFLDESGSIGKSYARADEIGVSRTITIDHDSLEDDTVTVRERDSTEQKRVAISSLKDLF